MKAKLYALLVGMTLCACALAADPQVELTTNMGTITIELYPDKAPKTVENFLQYVKNGQYKGTIFHRVISGFMIQGGGFTTGFVEKKTRGPIQNEANNGLKNEIGTVAMARKPDPNSATAQFFINHRSNDFLNYTAATPQGWGYAVFGKVVSGMDVVHKIATIETGSAGPFPSDVPRKTVIIEDAKILSEAKPATKK